MIFRLSSLGPLTLMKTGPHKCVSSHFSKCLDPDYYQAKLGAFIQKSLGVLTIRVKYHTFVEMEGYGPSNDIKLTDI